MRISGICTNADDKQRGTNGHGCFYYDIYGNEKYCGDFDDSDFTANSLCCACGGGILSIIAFFDKIKR